VLRNSCEILIGNHLGKRLLVRYRRRLEDVRRRTGFSWLKPGLVAGFFDLGNVSSCSINRGI
jgi:hypothetical protein